MKIKEFYLTAYLLIAGSAVAGATNYNIDFSDYHGAPSSTYGAASGQVGVWNGVGDLSYSLVDLEGNLTGASLSLDVHVWNLNAGGPSGLGDYERLLGDMFMSSAAWKVTITGLENGIYSFYFYAGNNSSYQTGPFTINGIYQSNSLKVTDTSSTVFEEGVNWGVVHNVIVSDGTLSVVSDNISAPIGLSGAQLVKAVPEPGTYLLIGTAGAAFAFLRRKRS